MPLRARRFVTALSPAAPHCPGAAAGGRSASRRAGGTIGCRRDATAGTAVGCA